MSEEEKIIISKSRDSLSKLGASTRWLIEKAGIKPEGDRVMFVIGVRDKNEQDKMLARINYEFDGRVMERSAEPSVIKLHGIWFSVVVTQTRTDLGATPRLTVK